MGGAGVVIHESCSDLEMLRGFSHSELSQVAIGQPGRLDQWKAMQLRERLNQSHRAGKPWVLGYTCVSACEMWRQSREGEDEMRMVGQSSRGTCTVPPSAALGPSRQSLVGRP